MPAEETGYDGVPYGELRFEEVDWSEAVEHIRDRKGPVGRPDELDIEPEWGATEALADPRRLVGSAGSRSGLTVKGVGVGHKARRHGRPASKAGS